MRLKRAATGIGAAAASIILFSSATPDNKPEIVRAPVFECAGCVPCEEDDRIVYQISTQPEREWPELAYYCPQNPLEAECSDLGDCGGQEREDLIAALQDAAADQDASTIVTLLTEHSDQMYLVPERTAVQVLNCQGTGVGAQVALSTETLMAVSALLP